MDWQPFRTTSSRDPKRLGTTKGAGKRTTGRLTDQKYASKEHRKMSTLQKEAVPLLMEIVRKLDQFAPAELLQVVSIAHRLNDYGLLKALESFLKPHISGYTVAQVVEVANAFVSLQVGTQPFFATMVHRLANHDWGLEQKPTLVLYVRTFSNSVYMPKKALAGVVPHLLRWVKKDGEVQAIMFCSSRTSNKGRSRTGTTGRASLSDVQRTSNTDATTSLQASASHRNKLDRKVARLLNAETASSGGGGGAEVSYADEEFEILDDAIPVPQPMQGEGPGTHQHVLSTAASTNAVSDALEKSPDLPPESSVAAESPSGESYAQERRHHSNTEPPSTCTSSASATTKNDAAALSLYHASYDSIWHPQEVLEIARSFARWPNPSEREAGSKVIKQFCQAYFLHESAGAARREKVPLNRFVDFLLALQEWDKSENASWKCLEKRMQLLRVVEDERLVPHLKRLSMHVEAPAGTDVGEHDRVKQEAQLQHEDSAICAGRDEESGSSPEVDSGDLSSAETDKHLSETCDTVISPTHEQSPADYFYVSTTSSSEFHQPLHASFGATTAAASSPIAFQDEEGLKAAAARTGTNQVNKSPLHHQELCAIPCPFDSTRNLLCTGTVAGICYVYAKLQIPMRAEILEKLLLPQAQLPVHLVRFSPKELGQISLGLAHMEHAGRDVNAVRRVEASLGNVSGSGDDVPRTLQCKEKDLLRRVEGQHAQETQVEEEDEGRTTTTSRATQVAAANSFSCREADEGGGDNTNRIAALGTTSGSQDVDLSCEEDASSLQSTIDLFAKLRSKRKEQKVTVQEDAAASKGPAQRQDEEDLHIGDASAETIDMESNTNGRFPAARTSFSDEATTEECHPSTYTLSPATRSQLLDFFTSLERRVIKTIVTIRNAKDLTNLLYAFSFYGAGGPEFYSLLQTKLHGKLRECDTHSLARILWSFGNVGKKTGLLSSKFLEQWKLCAAERLHQWWPGHLCVALWGAATLDLEQDPFFRRELLNLLNPGGLSRMRDSGFLYPFLRVASQVGEAEGTGSEKSAKDGEIKYEENDSNRGTTTSSTTRTSTCTTPAADDWRRPAFQRPQGYALFSDKEEYERYCTYVRPKFWTMQARKQCMTPGFDLWAQDIRSVLFSLGQEQLEEEVDLDPSSSVTHDRNEVGNSINLSSSESEKHQLPEATVSEITSSSSSSTDSCAERAPRSPIHMLPRSGLEWSDATGDTRVLFEERKDLDGFLVDFFVTVVRNARVEDPRDRDVSFHCLLYHSADSSLHRDTKRPLGAALLRQRFLKKTTTCNVLNILADNWEVATWAEKRTLVLRKLGLMVV
ncbi:unnamed protein product [Amoebophrya sp. A120]|nr:unnamed protein product [Amoebophrya sp. A120]|eukprot:GSA120T00020848001.1